MFNKKVKEVTKKGGLDMGRKRKDLIDKSTTLMLKIDNRTLFSLCDEFGIEYDRDLELVETETIKLLIVEIEEIIKKIVK